MHEAPRITYDALSCTAHRVATLLRRQSKLVAVIELTRSAACVRLPRELNFGTTCAPEPRSRTCLTRRLSGIAWCRAHPSTDCSLSY
jgi:hypothetical protein